MRRLVVAVSVLAILAGCSSDSDGPASSSGGGAKASGGPAEASATGATLGVQGGIAPVYDHGPLVQPLNGQAINRRFWAPGLTRKFVPQGVTRLEAGGAFPQTTLLVSGYFSDNAPGAADRCAIYAVSPFDGTATKRWVIPVGCDHAGGVANVGGRRLFVADSHQLIEVAVDRAFNGQSGAVVRRIKLPEKQVPDSKNLNGSFAAFQGTTSAGCPCVLIGDHDRQIIRYYARADLQRIASGSTLDVLGKQRGMPVRTPVHPQGAAVDGRGHLWITSSYNASSSASWGRVQRVGAEYNNFVPAIEGMTFTPEGDFWAVGEGGSYPYRYGKFYPLLFRVTPGRLNHP